MALKSHRIAVPASVCISVIADEAISTEELFKQASRELSAVVDGGGVNMALHDENGNDSGMDAFCYFTDNEKAVDPPISTDGMTIEDVEDMVTDCPNCKAKIDDPDLCTCIECGADLSRP